MERTYENSLQIATAANIVPNIKLSFRALSGDLKSPAIVSPTNVQIEKASRLFRVNTVVISNTEVNMPEFDRSRNWVNMRAMIT